MDIRSVSSLEALQELSALLAMFAASTAVDEEAGFEVHRLAEPGPRPPLPGLTAPKDEDEDEAEAEAEREPLEVDVERGQERSFEALFRAAVQPAWIGVLLSPQIPISRVGISAMMYLVGDAVPLVVELTDPRLFKRESPEHEQDGKRSSRSKHKRSQSSKGQDQPAASVVGKLPSLEGLPYDAILALQLLSAHESFQSFVQRELEELAGQGDWEKTGAEEATATATTPTAAEGGEVEAVDAGQPASFRIRPVEILLGFANQVADRLPELVAAFAADGAPAAPGVLSALAFLVNLLAATGLAGVVPGPAVELVPKLFISLLDALRAVGAELPPESEVGPLSRVLCLVPLCYCVLWLVSCVWRLASACRIQS